LAEAEAELVAGYNIEYSGILFAAFFLGEYSNIFLMSALFIILFFGGWLFFGIFPELVFSIKIVSVAFFFIFVRANVPRYRFDQLMSIGWKVFLPFVLGFFFFVSGLIKSFIIII
jgi:NADH-quinone oxidoreductase subunit H